MSSKQDKETDSVRQEQASEMQVLVNLVKSLMAILGSSSPAIIANGLYTRQQVEKNLGVSDNTISAWIEFNGLGPFQPGTKEQLFFGQDIIDFARAHAKGINRPKTAKAKAAARKANGK